MAEATKVDLKGMSAEELLAQLAAGNTEVLAAVPDEVLDSTAKVSQEQKKARKQAQDQKAAEEKRKALEAQAPQVQQFLNRSPLNTVLKDAIDSGFKVVVVFKDNKLDFEISSKPTRSGGGGGGPKKDLLSAARDYATDEEIEELNAIKNGTGKYAEFTPSQKGNRSYAIKSAIHKEVDEGKRQKRSTPAELD